MKQVMPANACGVSQFSFSNWECGRHQPSPDKLSVIAEMPDVSTDSLLGLSDKENPEKRDASPVAETDEIRERLRRNLSLYAFLDAAKDMSEHDLNRFKKTSESCSTLNEAGSIAHRYGHRIERSDVSNEWYRIIKVPNGSSSSPKCVS